MIGGKVRFALHSVDNQKFGFLTGRYRQLHVRGEGRTAHADDAGRLDPVENLFGFERAFAHQIGRKIDFRHPLVAFALDRNHHLTHPLPVGLQVDGRYRARNRSVDVGRHETRGFGDQLPREHLVAFGDLRHGRRADMLSQRNPHFVGQRAGEIVGSRSVDRRISKAADTVKLRFTQEVEQILKLRLCLSGEAHDKG